MGSKNKSKKNLSRNKENKDIEEYDVVNKENEDINNDCCTSYLTTNTGSLVSNDTNSETVGSNGPVLIQDVHLIDKMAHFDRERIPERVVHAKGAGAHGYFEVYRCMEEYTCADFLQVPKAKIPVFVRFSTVIGSKGSADTVRDPRGFAVKFYTSEGNYDIVGNDIPVFFIRDSIKFPDVIHSLKPSPDTNLKDVSRFWDFISNSPEAMHMITWLYSDRGTIKSYRHIDGFGVNTYVWVNSRGKRRYVKYHWKTMQGVETIDRHEAEILAGLDPDIAVRDLHEAIECGKYPKYELYVQLMDIEEAENLPFNPLDDTKTWPEDRFPLKRVGMMTLNKNPENFFAEVEQSAFCPANIVRGIEFSDDKMLQGRIFSYSDTQRYRLGINFTQLPINKAKCPVDNNNQDGLMRYDYKKGSVNYKPNSLNGNKPIEAPEERVECVYVEGNITKESIKKTDDFTQAGERYRGLNENEKTALIDNILSELWQVPEKIQRKLIEYFTRCDDEFGDRIAEGLNLKSKKSINKYKFK